MKFTHIQCGPFANESESKAFEHLKSSLKSLPGDQEWVILTNLAFSVSNQMQSDEIDIVIVGSPGITVVEVKHWTSQWVNSNQSLAIIEADKLTMKARKVGTTLRKSWSELGKVEGIFLLTADNAIVQQIRGEHLRGVEFFTLKDWKRALRLDGPNQLDNARVRSLSRILEPRSGVVLDGSLRRFGGLIDLELLSSRDQRFHRIYKGRHSVRQDRVILHLYDLSAYDGKNARVVASREFEALHRLQRFSWAPRVLDSFQDARAYPGEMCFFTVVDPASPNLGERAEDESFTTEGRVAFALATIDAVRQMHECEDKLVHRNLTPATILVRHDETPVLSGFHFAKIPSDTSVASAFSPSIDWENVAAPEAKATGLAAADQRSDVYSLCASLQVLFHDRQDPISMATSNVLGGGMRDAPEERRTLSELSEALGEILGEEIPQPVPPPARFWSEEQIIPFRDRQYRIVTRLGAGGIGATFKVVEIDRETNDDLGTYVAKVAYDGDTGTQILHSYSLARSHLGRHAGLSAIFEAATEWHENNFVALMTWVEGSPLSDFLGVLPLLAEDLGEPSAEHLAIRWLQDVCRALHVLHANGLIHGDISPRNLIVSGGDLVVTDYDFVTRLGDVRRGPGTALYCSPGAQAGLPASASDDIYALAASFFHVLFEKEPFEYGDIHAKERGLDSLDLGLGAWPQVTRFLERATYPELSQRFASAREALEFLSPPDRIETLHQEVLVQLSEQTVPWLMSVLQSYPGSRWGNRETRGLDSPFAEQTYVETGLEAALATDILERRVRLVVLCGNAGDGKTALLQHLALRLGFGRHSSAERILEHRLENGPLVRINLDGSASWHDRSAIDLLDEFLSPFQHGVPDEDITHLLAINDGPLLEWISSVESRANGEQSVLTDELSGLLDGEATRTDSHIRFIDLNLRSLVGGVHLDLCTVTTAFLDELLDQLYGGTKATITWQACQTCVAKTRCQVYTAQRVFGPNTLSSETKPVIRARARQRLYEALQAVHLRGEVHITTRELRAALVYILFGLHYCSDYHADQDLAPQPYWALAFDATSPERQGEVLRELVRFDPALEANPQVDRYLQSEASCDDSRTAPRYDLPLPSARRRAYFEWTAEAALEVARDKDAIGLARGRHLELFRRIPLMNECERKNLCEKLCQGISRLEDLPQLALSRREIVPLRITPRTPTETAFWVEKAIDRFRLEAELPNVSQGLDILHRRAHLIYRYKNSPQDRQEVLRMGAELFQLLLELSDGYQLGDASSDDTFSHISIFVQRLAQEDEHELMAWNPMQDEKLFTITARRQISEHTTVQTLVLDVVEEGSNT